MNTMNDSTYKKYMLAVIARSEYEDALLLFATELVDLKDCKHINLFLDMREEEQIRKYIDHTSKFLEN
jgi:hypothetical protein